MNPSDFTPLWTGQRGCSSPLKMVAVRGALEHGNPNLVTVYDDLIFVLDERSGTVTTLLASVDPSAALIQEPINPDGAAQLAPGVWFFAKGIHKENPAWPCLVQAEDFTVFRLAKDGSVRTRQIGDFGIHFHSGGTGSSTKRFSAGCQIPHNGDGYFQDPTWGKIIHPIYAAMDAYGIRTLPYMLIDAKDFHLPIPTTGYLNPIVP